MFTGIIDHLGTITEVETLARGLRVEIACEFGDIAEGESIAVDGAGNAYVVGATV